MSVIDSALRQDGPTPAMPSLGNRNPWLRPGTSAPRRKLLVAVAIVAALVAAVFAAKWRARPVASETASSAAHEHGEAVTVWQDGYEVFVEVPPLVAGAKTSLPFHVTNTVTGEPVSDARIELRLSSLGSPFVATSTALGIHVSRFIAPAAGAYEARLLISRDRTAEISLPDLTIHADAKAASAASHEHEPNERIVSTTMFLKEQQWRMGLLTAPVERRQLIERLAAPGAVRSPSSRSALVTPPTAGTLYPPPGGQFPSSGDQVEKGQLLAILEPSLAGGAGAQLLANQAQLQTFDAELAVKQIDAETRAKVAERELQFAKRSLERIEKLATTGAATAKQLDEAKLQTQLAQQRLAGAQEQLKPYVEARNRLAGILGHPQANTTDVDHRNLRVELRSPLTGTVVEAHATPGQYLNVGERIFRVVSLDLMFIEANVSEYDLGRVQQAPGASYRLSAYPDQIVPILGSGGGRLHDVGSVVDPLNRTVVVRYEVPNPAGQLRVDMFAEVLVETARRENALAVPESAVLDEGDQTLVIVQRGGESFEQRPVKTGVRDGDWIEIVDGLQAGERVVTRGARAIRIAALSGAIPAHSNDH